MQKLKEIVVDGERQPIGAVSIRFVPQRISKKTPYPSYKAIAIKMNGQESRATCAEISLVCGHQFWQCETDCIGADTLKDWLAGDISDDEAASGPFNPPF